MNVQRWMSPRILVLAALLSGASAFSGCARGYSDAASAPAEGAPPAPPPPATAPSPATPSSLAAPEPELSRDESAPSSGRIAISDDSPRTLQSLDEAVAEFERAKAELDGALALNANAPKGGSGAGAAPAPAPARARPRASTGDRAEAAEAPKDKPAKKAEAETSCQTACRAFASLERAADSVCRLAGNGDARCARAKEIVTAAVPRVASCGCHPDDR